MSFMQLLFSFQGRIDRRQFWLGVAIILGVVVLGGLSSLHLISLARTSQGNGELFLVGLAILVLGFGAYQWACAAVIAKRLHDRNRSASWLFLYLPLIQGAISSAVAFAVSFSLKVPSIEAGPPIPLLTGAYIIAATIQLIPLIDLGFMSGTDGYNKYDIGAATRETISDLESEIARREPNGHTGLGGMDAAMKAMETAVGAAQREAPSQFGRLTPGATSGGFGRRV